MQNELQTETNDLIQTAYSNDRAQIALSTTDTKTAQAVGEWLMSIGNKAILRRRLLMAAFTVMFLAAFLPLTSFAPLLAFVVPFVFIGVALLMSGKFTAKPTWNAAELAQVGGVQAIGTIIDLLMSPGVEVSRPSLVEALTILLPQRRIGDGHPLNPVQSAFLIRFLQIQFSGGVSIKQWNSYRVAALKALEQIGRASGIPHVERLAHMKLSDPDDARVKQAAIECLPMLKANYSNVETNVTLLRPSGLDKSAPETLLRAATSSDETVSRELLRTSNTDSPAPPSA